MDVVSGHQMLKLLIAICIPVLYWVWWRYRRLALLSRYGIPVPTGSFWTGNFSELVAGNVPAQVKWRKEYGKVFGYNSGVPTVVVADAELVRHIQVKDFNLFASRRRLFLGSPDGNDEAECSLISTEISPQRWKEQRSLITTAFTSSKIKSSVLLINDAIDGLMDNIKERADEPDFDIFELFQRLTMDTIGRSAFGVHTNVQRNPNDPFFLQTKEIFDDQSKNWRYMLLFANILFPEFTPVLYPLRKLQYQILKHFTETGQSYHLSVCRRIINQRKAQIVDPDNPWSRNDLLQQMLEASMTSEQMSGISDEQLTADEVKDDVDDQSHPQNRTTSSKRRHHMTDNEVAANASVFFDAGFETTSTLLGFLTHVLVNRQDVQDRLREEVNALYEKDGKLDYNTMNALPLLDAAIYETLRYYPPVTEFVTRHSTVEYKFGDVTIPPNVGVVIGVYLLHHDPDYWQDPHVFDLERFFGPNKSRASSPAFQAFGAGPRNCVGLRFALMEAKLTVARLLRHYKLVPGPRTEAFESLEIAYKPVTMSPKNGVFVKAQRIDH